MSDTNQDAKVMQLAATLPEVQPELLDVAKQAVAELDAAVRAGDDSAVALAKTRYDAVVWKLNGGTFFGCDGGRMRRQPWSVATALPSRGGTVVGQNGEF